VSGNGVRLRQAVLAATDLEAVAGRLASELGLGEPYADPGVAAFGLQNAVFALGDTFLEVVSPIEPDTAAGRWIERRGGDCGYMLMFQVTDLEGARARAGELGIREVLKLDLDDIGESHLHPADMRGAIVSVSRPAPPGSWRWGGPGWKDRATDAGVAGVAVTLADPESVRERWSGVLGVDPADAGAELLAGPEDAGLTTIGISGRDGRDPVEIGGVRFEFAG
jgi:glyoxalase-like protein